VKQAVLVFVGGGLGSLMRFLLSKPLNSLSSSFYWGTFSANILGCLLLGLLTGYSLRNSNFSTEYLLLFATGFCGGFTTFSTFVLEKNQLLRDGQWLAFFLYLISSIAVGYLFLWVGLWLTNR
jgi:CrcB protein